ncbi:hypothetical protein [Shewanella algae]|uniref:hypothetical protein n=1 Tax=Shewanella algae TaxID=38313 RepID=UPI001AAD945C|nr:hypothetical protein [Shewanella algae]MBO2682801.1 hypothetical protein [Shewanella algae]
MTDTNTIRRLALKLRNNRQRLAALYLKWILPQGINRSLEAELLGLTVRRVHEFRAYDAELDTMTDVQRRLTFDAWLEQQQPDPTRTPSFWRWWAESQQQRQPLLNAQKIDSYEFHHQQRGADVEQVVNQTVSGRPVIGRVVPTFAEVVSEITGVLTEQGDSPLLRAALERYQSEGYIVDFATVERFLTLLDAQWIELEQQASAWGYLSGVQKWE